MEPVSVVIPTYNRARLVGRAIRSALAAIDEGDEIVVVDDGSTDDTEARVRAFGSKVRYIRTRNGGVSAARNVGIEASRCPMVALLDSDDEWIQDKLILQKQVMAHWPEAVFCCAEFGARMSDGSEHLNWLRSWTHEERPWEELFGNPLRFSAFGELPPGRADFDVYPCSMYPVMVQECYVATNTFLARKELAGDALRFPVDQKNYEDWECFARVAKKGLGVFMNCCMSWQWEHEGPRVSDTPDYERAICRIRMTDRVWGSDPEFLAAHPGAIEAALESTHLLLGRRALVEGRHADAKAEFARSGATLQASAYRVLAATPGLYRGVRAAKKLASRRG